MHPGLKLPIVCVITLHTTAVPPPGNCTQAAYSLNATVCEERLGIQTVLPLCSSALYYV